MSESKVVPVILCGGSGTRLWPRSRAAMPKPFLPLVGKQTLFEQALRRCQDETLFEPPIVVTGSRLVEHVQAQLGIAPDAQVIVEPEAKNTAAAIAVAAHRLPADAVMLVCPSDHHVGDSVSFSAAAREAAALARDGWLVAVAIKPTRPDTAFGYLRKGRAIRGHGFEVEEFVEKPDISRAAAYLASGEYSWNGGIFAFRVRDFLMELDKHRPLLAAAVREAAEKGRTEGDFFYPEPSAYSRINAESVDYAVMENTDHAAMVPAELNWSDIGSWAAVLEARDRDEQGNSVRGSAELIDCRNVLVESDGPRVHVIGLEDVMVVVDGSDVVVISSAGSQKVGKLKAAQDQ